MKLSKVERLALINQYKILDMVDNSNDHAEKIDILKNGYVYLYSKVFEDISDDQDICSCEFYYNVLNMHNRLGIEFAGIPIEDDNFDYVCHLLEYKFVKVKGAPRFFGNRVPNYKICMPHILGLYLMFIGEEILVRSISKKYWLLG